MSAMAGATGAHKASYRTVQHAHAPTFEPGSGWSSGHPAGLGTPEAIEATREAAWHCFTFPLRRNGLRILATDLLKQVPLRGAVVGRHNERWWYAELYGRDDYLTPQGILIDMRMVKGNDTTRQYSGWQATGAAAQFQYQTWLCSKTEAELHVVLERMIEQETGVDPNAKNPNGLFRTL